MLPTRIGADDRGGSEPAKAVGFQPLLAERILKILALRLIEDRFHAAVRLPQPCQVGCSLTPSPLREKQIQVVSLQAGNHLVCRWCSSSALVAAGVDRGSRRSIIVVIFQLNVGSFNQNTRFPPSITP